MRPGGSGHRCGSAPLSSALAFTKRDAMRSLAGIAAAFGLAAGLGVQGAAAQDVAPPAPGGEVHVVGFVDVDVRAVPAAITALRTYRDASRKEAGALEVQVLQEIGRPDRFMITERWREPAAYAAHGKAAAATRLKAGLAAPEIAPADMREHRVFAGVPAPAGRQAARGRPVYAMTHLDVAPPLFSGLPGPLATYVAASRRTPGLVSFDVLQHVPPRQNHITVIEAWSSEAALQAQRRSPAARKFRSDIAGIIGSLYDDRLYRPLN